MPLSWISDWRGYTFEVLQGTLRLTGELMAFDTLLHFFGMWACLWVREMDTGESWGHLIVVLLIWNQALAAMRCKVCCSPHTDTVRGVLRACWILGITAESSAPRATDHAACPLREWESTALLPARLRLCSSFSLSSFRRPPYSIYVAFPCPSQGLISFPQCGRAGRTAGEPVCAEACDLHEQQGHSSSSLCWCPVGMSGIPPAQNVVLGWEPTLFAGQCRGFKDECKWSFACCHLAVRHISHPLLSARMSLVGELKGTIRSPAALETFYREQKVPCTAATSSLILVPFTWISSSCWYSSTAWHPGVLLGFLWDGWNGDELRVLHSSADDLSCQW